MKFLKYFLQFVVISLFFLICKIIGYKNSSNLGASIVGKIGPFFRSKKTINKNLTIAFPQISDEKINFITKNMWENYGRILADYVFLKDFRKLKLKEYVRFNDNNILSTIKKKNKPVIFISGHFNNFELLAMHLEMEGINLAAIYRPLNNIFLNKIMEHIRSTYICKKQIPKGIAGVKTMVNLFKKNTSLALMIDQRVSQGSQIKFFNQSALTTTIPAQFVKKYQCLVVPVYVERNNKSYFELSVEKPFEFNQKDSVEFITQTLNRWLEEKIKKNPNQWIWTHNRWK